MRRTRQRVLQQVSLLLFKFAEAELGDRCLTLGECGGYTGAVCTNGSCHCVGTINAENQCKLDETSPKENITIAVTMGVVFLQCLLLVVAILVYRKCGRGGFNVKSYDDLIFSDITASAIGYTPITTVSKIKPVKIDMFQNHVHELLRDDGIELFKEYTVRILYIDSSDDFNRVKLLDENGMLEGSYINASHVFQNRYIITQFPQRRTMVDFWRMVWEQNVTTIIMLAPLNEMKMCFRYYSRQPGRECVYGDIKITVIATFMYGQNMKIRHFVVSRERVNRRITQFHVYAWNHLSIAQDIVDCIKSVKLNVHSSRHISPIVVHSGSGVEWSGIFVLVDYLIQKIEIGSEVIDVPAATLNLLDERMSIISKKAYGLVYSCLHEYLKRNIPTSNDISTTEQQEHSLDYEELP
ncbi:receptor-type tyrosine-protein phosphatase epsilon isoform X3 [Magallana gigas]|uniref:receptor-type tyrosine-protein phosphatase epsilon isoform X3 n=1 Tax=Magallana gigas TaxID=29159 RepID=UPI00334258AC